MIEYFKKAKLHLPKVITAGEAKEIKKAGQVSSGIAQGMMLVRRKAGGYFRLSWNESKSKSGKTKKGRARAVPPGLYKLALYRIHGKDKNGDKWFLSVIKPHLRQIALHRGQKKHIAIKPAIHLKLKSFRNAGGVRIAASIMDAHHGGMTIYHKGKRITLGYRVEDAKGKTLARGTLQYG